MLFFIVGFVEKKRSRLVSQWIIKVGNLCFGVYLLQQFILKSLYNYTNLPSVVGCYWLPWVGFTIALIGSLIIAQILVKTKVGRFLIG